MASSHNRKQGCQKHSTATEHATDTATQDFTSTATEHDLLQSMCRPCERCVMPTGNWCDGCEFNYEEHGLRGRALYTRCEATYGQCTHCARSAVAPGTLVELRGLKALHMNGLLGEVLRFNPSRDRFAIQINYDSEANTAVRQHKEYATEHSALYGGMRNDQTGIVCFLIRLENLMATSLLEWDSRNPDDGLRVIGSRTAANATEHRAP